MVADGLTKGSSDRTLLSALMDGSYVLEHAVHEYIEPVAKENIGLAVQEYFEYADPALSEEAQPPRAPQITTSGVSDWTIGGCIVIEPKFQKKKLHIGSCVTAEDAQQPRPLPCPVLHGAI